ncbi:MAG: DUF560 domain-containing protein, partial [Rhizobiales bacterium]|nr:DUF560 domain-containing protein [Hyphomicrobiales bacterium]
MRKYLLIILISFIPYPSVVSHAAEPSVTELEQGQILDKLLLAARLSFKQKNYSQAIDLYHHILSRDPSIVQVRFSLAEAYLLLKKYEQAQYHFKLVLAQKIPKQISNLIRSHLAYINHQKIWQATYGFNITPESNINQGTNNKIIMIGGIPFTLNDDNLAQRGINLNANGALVISPQINDTLYGHFKIFASGNYLTDSKQLNFNLGGELGLSIKEKTNKYSAGLTFNKQYFDRKPYSNNVGVWMTWDKLLSNKLSWNGRISANKTIYNITSKADYNISIAQSLRYEHNAKFGFNFSPTLTYKKSHNKLNDNATATFLVGTRHSLPNNFTINSNFSAKYGHYFQKNNLFGKKRKDLTFGVGVKITNSKIRIFDFAPYIEY